MARKVSFSGQHLDLSEISYYYWDLDASVRLYFSPESPMYDVRFAGYVIEEVTEEMEIRLGKHGRTLANG